MKKKNFIASEHSTSPINISGGPNSHKATMNLDYPNKLTVELSCTVTINGPVITASLGTLNEHKAFMAANGETYELRQLHVHTPSEHTIDQKRHALEWHFVHQTEDGHYAVIGVFMDSGQETTEAYKPLIEALAGKGTLCAIRPRLLIPEKTIHWHYNGTLTTPPYDPVYWTVMEEVLTISEADLAVLMQAMKEQSS